MSAEWVSSRLFLRLAALGCFEDVLGQLIEGLRIAAFSRYDFPVAVEHLDGWDLADALILREADARLDLRAADEVEFEGAFRFAADVALVDQRVPLTRVVDNQAEDGVSQLFFARGML